MLKYRTPMLIPPVMPAPEKSGSGTSTVPSASGDESDGYAEAWFLPAANNVPAGHATNGTWYDFFAGKAAVEYGTAWGRGQATSMRELPQQRRRRRR